MDEHHVRHAVADLVEGGPDVVAEDQCIVFGSMTGAPASEDDRGSFGHRCTALGLGTGAQEIAPFDECGSQHDAVIEARTGDRLPGGTELVEVKGCRDFAHLFERQHRALGALRPLDLGLEVMGVDLGSIDRSNQRADLVGRPVKGRRFAFGGPVKDVDEGPAKIFGVGFKRGPGHHGEKIGPDRFESLDDRLPDREIAGR